MRARALLLALVAVALIGCGPAIFTHEDLTLAPLGDTLYVVTRNSHVSRNFCSTLGADVARVEGAFEGPRRVRGCYTTRHIIVCATGDEDCIAHEERHRREGQWHR